MNSPWSRIIVFCRTVNALSGGMDVHLQKLREHAPLCISKDNGLSIFNTNGFVVSCAEESLISILERFVQELHPLAFFFNDLAFVSHFHEIREGYPEIQILLRSGGNDLYRAPINDDTIPLKARQIYIKGAINNTVDTFIVNSDYSYLRSIEFGIKTDIIKKVRGGVDQNLCTKYVAIRREIRHEFDILYNSQGLILFAFACRMKKFKGICPFLDVILRHPIRFSSFLLFIGDGEDREYIEQKLKLYPSQIQYCFMGEIPNADVLKWLSCSDYVLNPSIEEERHSGDGTYIHTETMGRTMMEALSLHIPIIASNVGGTNELFLENYFTGYLYRSEIELTNILNDILHKINIQSVRNSVDYSWTHVFGSYETLISTYTHNKDALVLDLDGTLIDQSTDMPSLAKVLDKHHDKYVLILNTARIFDEETFQCSCMLHADYIICENGLHIYSGNRPFMWNVPEYLNSRIISEAEDFELRLQNIFPKHYEVRRTHPHIIQIRKEGGSSFCKDEQNIVQEIIAGSSFEYVHCDGLMKIYSRLLSKGAALNYILKDLNCKRVIAAGNSLNDFIFVKDSDLGWIESSLSSLARNLSSKIETFEQNEIGLPLLMRIFKTTCYEK